MKCASIFWFTGLSGSGKTTVASLVKLSLEKEGLKTLIVDGDEFRKHHRIALGFSERDIKKNNELIVDFCRDNRKDFEVILVPIISPYALSRKNARMRLGEGFYEIYFNASLECVVARDTKGLYSKAKNNEIHNLIGFSDSNPYESPQKPDLRLDTSSASPSESAKTLLDFICSRLKVNS